eukprot:763005-Hanusia_phi.AAC.7
MDRKLAIFRLQTDGTDLCVIDGLVLMTNPAPDLHSILPQIPSEASSTKLVTFADPRRAAVTVPGRGSRADRVPAPFTSDGALSGGRAR